MKRILWFSLATLVFGASAPAVLILDFNSGFANGGVIPDGALTGWQDTRTLSGMAAFRIIDVNVRLTLSGGWNGDLYGYLRHDTGFAVLLNRAGRTAGDSSGYGDTGFDVILDDTPGNPDIHLYQLFSPSYDGNGRLLGSWQSDARETHPLSVLDTDPRTATLDSFNTLDANGDWTLFLADVSAGEESTVVRWGLAIETVPETPSWIPALCLLVGIVLWDVRLRRQGAPE